MAEIYDKQEQFKAALLKRERAASSRLVRAYGQSWQRLAKLLLQITDKIGEAQARGIEISPAWLYQQERYARLMTEIEREIRKFAATAERAILQEQQAAVKAALRDSAALVKAAATPEISASFVSLNASAVESAVGFLADGSPLSRLLDELPREAGRRVREALTEATALGYNPRKMAARVRHEAGMTLTRALRIARTETLRSYREAAHANYKANDDVIQGWYWVASLSRRTCATCIALHGTFHPLEERMASHVQCRCTAIPALTGQPSPIAESGEAWFDKQNEATQRAIIGTNAGYEAFKRGDLRLRDFVGEKRNPLWGKSYVQLGVKRALDGEGTFPGVAPPPIAAPKLTIIPKIKSIPAPRRKRPTFDELLPPSGAPLPMLEIKRLLSAAGVPQGKIDTMILSRANIPYKKNFDYSAADVLALLRHDFPAILTDNDKRGMVKDPQGNWYVGASLRNPPQK